LHFVCLSLRFLSQLHQNPYQISSHASKLIIMVIKNIQILGFDRKLWLS
jgi:hypothetical protein